MQKVCVYIGVQIVHFCQCDTVISCLAILHYTTCCVLVSGPIINKN